MTDHPVLFWVLTVDALLWIAIARYIAVNKRDPFHIGVIFSLMFILSYPLKFIGSLFGFAVMNPLELPEEWLWWSTFFFNLSGIMFILPMLLMKPVVGSIYSTYLTQAVRRPRLLFLIPIISVFIITLSFGQKAIIAVFSLSADLLQERIAERADERLGSGPLALLRTVGEVLLIISAFQWGHAWVAGVSRCRTKIVLFLSIICPFFLLLSGSKHIGLMPLIYFLILLHLICLSSGRPSWTFSRILQYGVVGVLLIGIFGYIRGFFDLPEDELVSGILLQTTLQLFNAFDAPDNLTFILARMKNIWGGDLVFMPTLQYIASVIPRFLWPDKPDVFGNLFIQKIYLYERFTDGLGEVISPSMPGEMLLSGGVFFMCLWSIALGMFFAAHYVWAYRAREWVFPALYVFLAANVFNVLRSGTGVLGAYILFAFAVGIVWIVSLILHEVNLKI